MKIELKKSIKSMNKQKLDNSEASTDENESTMKKSLLRHRIGARSRRVFAIKK